MKSNVVLFLILMALVFAVSCSKSSTSSNQKPNGASPDAPPVAAATPVAASDLDVSVESVSESGRCLNIQKVYERLAALPSGSLVREVTTSVQFEGRPNRLRDQFLHALTAQNYIFNEGSPADFFTDRPTFTQQSCDTVTLVGPIGTTETYSVSSTGADQVTIQTGNHRETYRLVGARELLIINEDSVIDDCNRRLGSFPVQTTTVWRWDDAAALDQINETLNHPFVDRLTEALVSVPLDLAPALRESYTSNADYNLSAGQLKTLLGINESIDTRRCSDHPWPIPTPTPAPEIKHDEPLDLNFDATPTPTPTPMASPAASPTATPGTSPTPAASPAAAHEDSDGGSIWNWFPWSWF